MRPDGDADIPSSFLVFLGFLGFLDRLLALHKGHMGALRCICWLQDMHVFMGGGCCLNEFIWSRWGADVLAHADDVWGIWFEFGMDMVESGIFWLSKNGFKWCLSCSCWWGLKQFELFWELSEWAIKATVASCDGKSIWWWWWCCCCCCCCCCIWWVLARFSMRLRWCWLKLTKFATFWLSVSALCLGVNWDEPVLASLKAEQALLTTVACLDFSWLWIVFDFSLNEGWSLLFIANKIKKLFEFYFEL